MESRFQISISSWSQETYLTLPKCSSFPDPYSALEEVLVGSWRVVTRRSWDQERLGKYVQPEIMRHWTFPHSTVKTCSVTPSQTPPQMSFSCQCYLVLHFVLLNDWDFYFYVFVPHCLLLTTGNNFTIVLFVLIMTEFLVAFSLNKSYLMAFLRILNN